MTQCNPCMQDVGVSTTTAEKTSGFTMRPLNDCGNKLIYKAKAGATFKQGMPVKFADEPNTVEPSLDGVGAIGISHADIATATDDDTVLTQQTGWIYWSEMAQAVGKDVKSKDDWWAIHKELAKANIYTEFK